MENEHRLIAGRFADAVTAADTDAQFKSLLETHLPSAFRLASVIIGNAEDAEDATQDALARAWRARSSLRGQDRFDPWFQRIVVNACRDSLRRNRRGPLLVGLEVADARPSGDVDVAQEVVARNALNAAFDRLNADQRIALAMRYFLDLEVDEIARRTGARLGTVKSRINRGLNQLRVTWEADQ
jgi:RNA polymerase sigma-70 factor (ECF subfamily)